MTYEEDGTFGIVRMLGWLALISIGAVVLFLFWWM